MEVVAIAMVEITSPSSLPGFTLAASMELMAAGAFRLVMLPVTKARYVPPLPSIGAYVKTSIEQTVQ